MADITPQADHASTGTHPVGASEGPGGRTPPRDGVPAWLDVMGGWAWRVLVIGLVLIAVWVGVHRVLVVSMSLIVALILSTLCIPVHRWLVRRGLSNGLAAAVVVVGGLVAFIGLLAALAPAFVDQVSDLGPTVVQGWDQFLDWLQDGPLGIDRAQLQDLIDRAQGVLSGGGGGSSVVGGLLSGVATVGQFLTGLVLTIVVLFFMVKDHEELLAWGQRMLPDGRRTTAAALAARGWTALSGYVRGTALIALIDAMGIGIGLAIIGVPLVLPLTVLVFFGGFLPVIGATLSGLVAVLVALAAGGISKALWTLGVVLLVQQAEANLLQPTIMRRTVALHPIVILAALTAGGTLGGVIGAFLAVPIAAVLAALGNELRLRSQAGLLGAGTDAPAKPIGGPKIDDESAMASMRATAAERAKQRRQGKQG